MSIRLCKCIYTYVCSFLSLGTYIFNAFGIFKIMPLDVSSNLPGFLWPSLVKTKNNCYFIRALYLRIVSTYFKSIRSISWNMRRIIRIIKYFEKKFFKLGFLFTWTITSRSSILFTNEMVWRTMCEDEYFVRNYICCQSSKLLFQYFMINLCHGCRSICALGLFHSVFVEEAFSVLQPIRRLCGINFSASTSVHCLLRTV